MFPRHHRTKKTTTPQWNNDKYLVHVRLKPTRLVGSNLTIRRRTPMCRAFYRHLSLGNIQPLLRRFREIDDGKKPLWERSK